MTKIPTTSDDDSEIAILSSESEVHINLEELESENTSQQKLISDLDSDEDLDELQTDKVFAQVLKKRPTTDDSFSRGNPEQLWRQWENDIHNYGKLERIKLKLESSIRELSDPDHFKRHKTENNDRKSKILKGLKNDISEDIVQELIDDKFDSTKDWYYLTLKPDLSIICSAYDLFLGKKSKIHSDILFEKFGADVLKTVEFTYCSYNELIPVEIMCNIIEENFEDSETFFQHLIKFILDRRVFVYLSMKWCVKCWKSFTIEKLKVYFDVIPKDMYLLHLRFTRLIPIQQDLIDFLFQDYKHLQMEVKRLLGTQDWNRLLQFFLFVFGSRQLPFGRSKSLDKFRTILEDIDVDGSNQIQLSIIKSYITACTKIRK